MSNIVVHLDEKVFKTVPEKDYFKYKNIQRRLDAGESILLAYMNKNSVGVIFKKTCKLCKSEYAFHPNKDILFSEATENYCSNKCSNYMRGTSFRGKSRDPKQFKRGKAHHSYNKNFYAAYPEVDWFTSLTEEITLDEGKKYVRVQKALDADKNILQIFKITTGFGVSIKVITEEFCENCGRMVPSDVLEGRKTCSYGCSKELAGKSLHKLYEKGLYSGNTGSIAWNKGLKVDKKKYPNWGRAWWDMLSEEERIERMHNFACPRMRSIVLGDRCYKVRSGFEEDFLTFLFSNNIDFEYEPKIFSLNKKRNYIPDVYIPELKLFIELKSFGRLEAYDKFNAFDVLNWIRERKKVIVNSGYSYSMVWYERFYSDNYLSCPKSLQELLPGTLSLLM